ncbi:MAG: hypothetical protein SCK28_12395, partial [Bacillota bacterium]|nr:hypothetical protein [Bacillota bacterium]
MTEKNYANEENEMERGYQEEQYRETSGYEGRPRRDYYEPDYRSMNSEDGFYRGDPRPGYPRYNREYNRPYQSRTRMREDYQPQGNYGYSYGQGNYNNYYRRPMMRQDYYHQPYYHQPYYNQSREDSGEYYGPHGYHHGHGHYYGGYHHPHEHMNYYGPNNPYYYNRPPQGLWRSWLNPDFIPNMLQNPRVNNFLRGVGLVTIGMFVAPSVARALRP